MAQKLNELFLLELLFQETKCNTLPWMSIRPCQEGSAILGGLSGYGTSPNCADRSQSAELEPWVEVPPIATKIRSFRSPFFTSVKCDFRLSVVDATTTSTLLSHDKYEFPREIRTVCSNCLKTARAMLGRKYTVFSPFLSETKNWEDRNKLSK
jgi:hypothetical protein